MPVRYNRCVVVALPLSEAINRALTDHRAGRLPEAEAGYRAALAADPDDSEILRLLAILKTQQGRYEEALALVSRALTGNPQLAKAHVTRGTILHALGRHQESLASYDAALAIAPDLYDAHYNRGIALQALDRETEAIASYDSALALIPDLAEALINRGNALQALGRHEEAIAGYDKALAVRPTSLEALNNRGTALQALGRYEQAIASYDELLRISPDSADVLNNRGTALHALERHADAVASYDSALAIKPNDAEILTNRGNALHLLGRHGEALASYERAIAADPDHAEARWSLTMFQLPMVCDEIGDPARYRAAFARKLEELDNWFEPGRLGAGFRSVGAQQPFLLAYQEENNRGLLDRYGRLCSRIMADWLKRQSLALPGPRAAGRELRIGIASPWFYNQSVWNAIVKGWFQRIDRARFSLHVFHLGSVEDEETLFARSRAAHFEQGKRSLPEWVRAIVGQRPDVLIYPEMGMDAMTVKLASMRLAPVQVVTWGHPETTGLPTLDYFLSAEDMEPPGAQDNYTERLVQLPHLGCFYSPPDIVAGEPDLDALGIGTRGPMLLCPGVPFKYAPEHDEVFPKIAARLGRCRLVFFLHRGRNLSEKLSRRLQAAFAGAGLDMDEFVRFIPWQTRQSFYGLMKRADVFLDTIGFSGFNTAIQAIECGLPVVTREGRFLRGRLASGILKRMGLHDLIAATEDGYVALATRLCQDPPYRARIRERIEQSRGAVFEDDASIRALEEFLAGAAHRAR